ncbi:16S rRNA (uracil(1498)-N(3))-methyltransferase [Tepidiforma sp.]|uniref:RsmE family RNA methyltransferase n=1 Tax=Tepidiforma sp. TaxID=2682230 RepID=UPI0021DC94DC|nr:RsmE family RNA methyltransferase [Tepidiforma sp.]MCX7618533.1 16S rRNA (uracil(1498)-N(3))-methyltransferase [Tepidiforma sp.]GIW18297.1 MAG: ribosomal RNA small subunit methyltransferase E [Tepidiforma sp.]
MGHIPRVYVAAKLGPGPVALTGETASRLATVLRARPSDELRLFGGEGHEWQAVVRAVERGRVLAEVTGVARQEPPPEPVVEAWLPIIRAQRLEWAVEKCTEAGADIIRLAAMEFGQRGSGPSDAKLERFERIAIEASEQCGRLYLPVIEAGGSLERLLGGFRGAVVAMEREGMGPAELAPLLPAQGRVAVVCGPEGGFSPRELDQLRRKGALFLRAGPNILRAETAAVAGVVLVRALAG